MSKKKSEKRVTKLVRFSYNSHNKLKTFSKERKETMSKILDHIIEMYFKHQRLYELD